MKKQPVQSTSRPVTLPIPDQPTLQLRALRSSGRRRPRPQRSATLFLFLIGDTLLINLAFLSAYYIRYNLTSEGPDFYPTPYQDYISLEIGITLGMLLILWLKGIYQIRLTSHWVSHFSAILGATTTGLVTLSIYEYFFTKSSNLLFSSSNSASRGLILYTWIGTTFLLFLGRQLVSMGLAFAYRHGLRRARLIVIGAGRLGKMMMQHIAATPRLGYHIIGYIDVEDTPTPHFGRFKALGSISDLESIIHIYHIDEVLIALPSNQHQQIVRSVRLCERAGAEFKLIPDLHELSLSRIDIDTIEGIPLIGIKSAGISPWQYTLKRGMDISIAGLILLLGSPIWLLTALAIKLDSRGPILFKQERLGYQGLPFMLYKFRSMHNRAERAMAGLRPQNQISGPMFKLKDDPRRTHVGKLIRKTSIDEIPQLLNVLKGDMSLVGPRPPLGSEVAQYEEWEKGRLEVRPGMTGLWQVRGRSELDFDEMVLLDLYYIENWSLRLDIQILLQTIPAVLFSRGAY
ncbi:MAG TPA: sugar transferase [Ktedonobacterales bacterium]|jgi:exopolysaccharide biosynthesis polyprenyl glycosylphosphotransferase